MSWLRLIFTTDCIIHIHRRHKQSVLAIGMLSQGHMISPLYHYTGQVAPRFGDSASIEEWKWCPNIIVEADILIRPLHNSMLTHTRCLRHWHVFSRAYGCTSCPQIWEVGFTWGVEMMPQRHVWVWGWYSHQATSNIHTTHINSVWAICMLSEGH